MPPPVVVRDKHTVLGTGAPPTRTHTPRLDNPPLKELADISPFITQPPTPPPTQEDMHTM